MVETWYLIIILLGMIAIAVSIKIRLRKMLNDIDGMEGIRDLEELEPETIIIPLGEEIREW